MCGLVGIASNQMSASLILGCLEKLEYRGYDSAGLSVLTQDGRLSTFKAIGPIQKLREQCTEPLNGILGIAHTRWATHGPVNLENAHPQTDGLIAVAHNGIIENFAELKAEFLREAPETYFASQTDTEIIVHMISYRITRGMAFLQAAQEVLSLLKGTFALVILNERQPDILIVARRKSPLVIGLGSGDFKGSVFASSDVMSIAPYIEATFDLDDDEICMIQKEKFSKNFICQFFDLTGQCLPKSAHSFHVQNFSYSKENFSDFTSKEITEQPAVIQKLIQNLEQGLYIKAAEKISQAQQLHFIACGSSFYAGQIGRYLFEKYARIPAVSEIASEFRYRDPVVASLPIFISQSGETIDTLGALDDIKKQEKFTLVLTNAMHSSMAGKADLCLDLQAGPEFGVVSTKAFTAQLALIMCLLIEVLKGKPEAGDLLTDLKEVPLLIQRVIDLFAMSSFDQAWYKLNSAKSVLFIGRELNYPVALESALKFKEISYIHAEGYPAGELKHGPLALIGEGVVTVALAPHDDLLEKTLSNVQEVMARGGSVILLTDEKGAAFAQRQDMIKETVSLFVLPETGPLSKIFVYTLAGQLIAYHMAQLRSCNVDRPRNLAKAVTVE